MHAVGPELGEHAHVVRDREHAEIRFVRHPFDPAGNLAERVDIETGVDLVQNRERRL